MSAHKFSNFSKMQKDINAWRYKGDWVMAQERAEKKSSKYYLSGSAFESLVVGEALLNIFLEPYLQEDAPYDEGLANSFIFIPLDQSIQETVLNKAREPVRFLENAYARAKEDYDREDFTSEHGRVEMQQSYTWLAWLQLVCGRASDALTLLELFSFSEAEETPDDADPYWKVMILAGLTIKALAMHMTGDDKAAHELTKRAVAFYSKHSSTPAPVPKKPQRRTHPPGRPEDEQWLRWFEISHYAHVLLSAKIGLAEEAIATARVYSSRIVNTPETFRTQSKVAVMGVFIRLLLGFPSVYRAPRLLEGIPKPVPNVIPGDVRTEVRQNLPLYEMLLTTLLPFPRGEDPGPFDDERHERVLECYDWYIYLSTYISPEEPIGDAADRHYRLIEDLYRATKHSFNSMRVLRYIVHTFTSLISFFGDNMPADEKTEAEAIMDTYAFLWDKHLNINLEKLHEQQEKEKAAATLVTDGPLAPINALPDGMGEPNGIRSKPAGLVEETGTHRKHPQHNGQIDSAKSLSETQKPTNVKINGTAHTSKDTPDSGTIQIGRVEGESIADAVGVLLAGTRMLFMNVEGQEQKLRKCVRYTEQAVGLLKNYGSECGLQLPALQQLAYRWLGISYGELAAEVRDSQQKREYQKKALEASKKAKTLNPNGWEVLYQRGLQLAEAGEVTMAILRVKESLQHNRAYAPSWNLLALLFSARKEFDQALKVCEIGVKECLASAESSAIVRDVVAVPNGMSNGRSKFSWEIVDSKEKEELINLKLTHVALEAQKHGPKQALDNLKKVLRLARKIFGGIDTPDDFALRNSVDTHRSTTPAPPELHVPTGVANGKATTRSRGSSFTSRNSGISSTLLSPSSTTIGSVYRFRAYDLFVCIWLTAAALYRGMEKFEEARGAVREAEKLADSMAQMDVMLRRLPSRVYQEVSMNRASQEQKKLKGLLKPTSGRSRPRKSEEEVKESLPFIPKWGPVGRAVRRVVADVAFEAAMVRQAEYDLMMRKPEAPKYAQYSTPTAQVQADRKLRSWKAKITTGGIKRTPSQRSFSTIQSASAVIPGERGTGQSRAGNASGSVRSSRGESGPVGTIPPVQVQVNGVAIGNTDIKNVSSEAPDIATAVGVVDEEESGSEPLTLGSLIDVFNSITHIDDDHLAARVHLGILYYKKGEIDHAEHHLERACKSAKSRGGGGGKSGQGSWYGGATGRWGWDGWRWLSRCLVKRERVEVAQEAIGFAVKMERCSYIRGLECLRRMVNSDL